MCGYQLDLTVVMIFWSPTASSAIHNKTPAPHIQAVSPCNKRNTPKSSKKGKSMISLILLIYDFNLII